MPRSSMDLERRSPKAKVTSSTLVGTTKRVGTPEGCIFDKISQSIRTKHLHLGPTLNLLKWRKHGTASQDNRSS